MKQGEKQQRKLEARISGHQQAVEQARKDKPGSEKRFTRPGSRNPNKQA